MTLEELEKRLTALEDLEQIKILQREYMSYWDNLEFSKIADLFAEDATVEVKDVGKYKGKKDIANVYMNIMGKSRTTREDGHLVGQPIVSIDGDRAKGRWLVYIFTSKPSVQWAQGINECEYVKENGKWKFSSLKFGRTNASQISLLFRPKT